MNRRIQNLLIIVFKTINNYQPEYPRDRFKLIDNINNLRGINKLPVPKPNMTHYGKKSVLLKVLGSYYLEQDFWYLKIPKYMVSF